MRLAQSCAREVAPSAVSGVDLGRERAAFIGYAWRYQETPPILWGDSRVLAGEAGDVGV